MSTRNLGTFETSSPNVKWAIEVYPFPSKHPSASDFSSNSYPKVTIVSTDNRVNSIIKKYIDSQFSSDIRNSRSLEGEDSNVRAPSFTSVVETYYGGVTNIEFDKSKFNPEPELRFSTVGRLPQDMRIGSWVVATSVSNIEENTIEDSEQKVFTGKTLTRFIGQISDVQVSYIEDASGNLRQSSTIYVRAWSWILNCPIEVDQYSYLALLKSETAILRDVSNRIKNLGGSVRDAAEKTMEMLNTATDPFEFVQVILNMSGMYAELDRLDTVTSIGSMIVPDLAATPPSIPPAVFIRLGIEPPKEAENSAFGAFVRLATGINHAPYYNKRWDGIFRDGGVSAYIDFLREGYEKNKKVRPKIMGYSGLAQINESAWNLINRYSDSDFNEVMVDTWYEEIEKGNVVGKPVITTRDKPFMLKGFTEQSWAKENKYINIWTKYDDLPRVYIPNTSITAFNLETSVGSSPNFLTVRLTPGSFNPDAAQAASAVSGYEKMTPEIRRFGGKIGRVNTTYHAITGDNINPKEQSYNTVYMDWLVNMRLAYKSWHSYSYRMASGRLTIMDCNLAIPIGFNVCFKIGKHTLVGHVEGYAISATIDSRGVETTRQTISLSRIVCEYNDNGDLAFVEDFGDLFYAEPPDRFGVIG